MNYDKDLVVILAPTLITQVRRKLSAQPIAPKTGKIVAGARNSTLTSLAGTMRRRDFSATAIRIALLEENRSRCAPPLDKAEVNKIARSVSRYEPEAVIAGPTNGESTDAADIELLASPSPPEPYFFRPSFPPVHFVTNYITYASSRTDAPHEFHEGAALVLLANATPGIRATLSAYPNGLPTNLYGLFIGDSTRSRKSTALTIAKDILTRAIPKTLMPEQFSPEAFIEQLSARSPGPSCWLVDEFSEMLDKIHHARYMSGLRGLLLQIYGSENYEYRRHSKMVPSSFEVSSRPSCVPRSFLPRAGSRRRTWPRMSIGRTQRSRCTELWPGRSGTRSRWPLPKPSRPRYGRSSNRHGRNLPVRR